MDKAVKKYNSLERKFFLWIFGVCVTLGIIGGTLVTYSQKQRVIYDAKRELQNVCRRRAECLSKEIQNRTEVGEAANTVVAQALRNKDCKAELLNLKIGKDGAVRSTDGYSGAFLASNSKLTPQTQKLFARTRVLWKDLTPPVLKDFFNFYLITEDNFIRIAPKRWALEIESDHEFKKDIFYSVATPENNPDRSAVWTPVYYDSIWQKWMTSLIIPIYDGDRFVGITGSDYILDRTFDSVESIARIEAWCKGSLFDRRGNLLAHPEFRREVLGKMAKMNSAADNAGIAGEGMAGMVEKFNAHELASLEVVEFDDRGKRTYGCVVPIPPLGWRMVVYADHDSVTRGMGSLMWEIFGTSLVLAILLSTFLWFALRRLVLRRISKLRKVIIQLGSGDWNVKFPEVRDDEIGLLTQAFKRMCGRLYDSYSNLDVAVENRVVEGDEPDGSDRVILEYIDSQLIFDLSLARDGRIVEIRKASFEAFGVPEKELLGARFKELSIWSYDSKVQKELVEAVLEALEGTVVRRNFKIRVGQERMVDVALSLQPVFDATMRIKNVAIKGNDITGTVFAQISPDCDIEDRITEQICRNARTHETFVALRRAFEQSADGIAITNKDGWLQFMNEAWAKMHGYKPEELVGRHLCVFHTEKQVKRDFIPFCENVRARGSHDGEIGHIRKDGTSFIAWTSMSLLFDDRQAPVGMVSIARDITKQKQAEDELRDSKENAEIMNRELAVAIEQAKNLVAGAEAANKAKSEFLANMSHEIRTPINGVMGMTELALDTELTDEQRKYLTMAKESADSLLVVINDILDFSKIEAGKLELDYIDFNLHDCVEGCIRPLAMKAESRELEVLFDVAPELPRYMRGDPGRLRQILTNLVSNSIKFTNTGHICVSVGLASRNGREVVLKFEVRDTGIGIPPEKLERIFDAFEQADASTTREYGGTGLGLAISSQLVELMGGEIWADSEVGHGSRFFFTALLESVDEIENELPQKLEVTELTGLNVMIVDDNAVNRKILAEAVASWNMKWTLARDGQEAIDLLKHSISSGQFFELVILDANMPKMNGFSVAKWIDAMPEGKPTVLMLSSAGKRGDAAQCRETGVTAYLPKPISRPDLLSAITTCLGLQRHTPKDVEKPLVTRHNLRKAVANLRVLLVEDKAINQQLALNLLQKRGHKVTLASNGQEALDILETESFDLVLMDIQMPIMGGFEATNEIRRKEHKTGEHLPIIAMTAHAMKGDREKCLENGMDGYISKPINQKDMFETIESVLAGIRPVIGPIASGAPRASSTRSKIYDRHKALDRVGGDEQVYQDLVRMFLSDGPRMLCDVVQAIESGDGEKVAETAHSLKSGVGIFSADSAYEMALRIEMIGRQGDLCDIEDVFKVLENEVRRLIEALEVEVSESQLCES